jgi:DNA-binding Lrp family transcriptional regulator
MDLDANYIKRQYEKGSTVEILANELNVCDDTIIRRLKEEDVVIRPRWPYLDTKYIKHQYEKERSTQDIAIELGVSRNTITDRLKKAKVVVRPQGHVPKHLDTKYIKHQYEKGRPANDIAKELGVTQQTITRRLQKAKMVIRSTGWRHSVETKAKVSKAKMRRLDVDYIKQQYKKGRSASDIADEMSVSQQTIIRRLQKAKVAIRSNTWYWRHRRG